MGTFLACVVALGGCGDDAGDQGKANNDSGTKETVLPDGGAVTKPGVDATGTRAKTLEGVWVAADDPPRLVRFESGSDKVAESIELSERPQYVEIIDGVAFYINDTIHLSDAPSPIYHQNLLTGERGEIVLAANTTTGSLAYADGSLWLADESNDVVWRINPKTKEVVGGAKLGLHDSSDQNDSNDVAAGEGDVYVSSFFGGDSVARVGITSMKTEASGAEGDGTTGVAFGAGSIWLVSRFDGMLRRYEPRQVELQAAIDIDADISTQVRPVAVAAGSAWVLTGEGGNAQVICCEAAKPGLTRVDVTTNKVVAHIPIEHPAGLRAHGDELWVSTDTAALLIDTATNTVKRTLPVSGEVADVVFPQVGGGGGSTAGLPKIDVYSIVDAPPMICEGLTSTAARLAQPSVGAGSATLTVGGVDTKLSGICEVARDKDGKAGSYRASFASDLIGKSFATVELTDYEGDGTYTSTTSSGVSLIWEVGDSSGDRDAKAVLSNGGLHGVVTYGTTQLTYDCPPDSALGTSPGAPMGKPAPGEAIFHYYNEVVRFSGIGCRHTTGILEDGLVVDLAPDLMAGSYYRFKLDSSDPPGAGKPIDGYLEFVHRGTQHSTGEYVTVQLSCGADSIDGTFASDDKDVEGAFSCPKSATK